jgi:uracil phosphoribosyltransferase
VSISTCSRPKWERAKLLTLSSLFFLQKRKKDFLLEVPATVGSLGSLGHVAGANVPVRSVSFPAELGPSPSDSSTRSHSPRDRSPAITASTDSFDNHLFVGSPSGSPEMNDLRGKGKPARLAEYDNTEFPAHPHLHVLHQGNGLRAMHTVIRNHETPHALFVHTADRLMRLLVEEGLGFLPCKTCPVTTPVEGASAYSGMTFARSICAVSVVRAGEAMEVALRRVARDIKIGKILLRRDSGISGGGGGTPELCYARLPDDISTRHVLLLDPILATASTISEAIRTLAKHDVKQENITFLNLIATPRGIETLRTAFPRVSIVTTHIDAGLNVDGLVLPGIGDFGDR